jgi:peptidyl-prolyl cis-trans isomerase SurA
MTAFILSALRKLTIGTLLVYGLTHSLMAEAALKHGEQPLDNIVAVVNDAVITQTELNLATHMARSQLAANNLPTPPAKALRKQMLQQLINNKLQLEAAEQLGIHVDDTELDKVVGRIAQDNHISVKEFYEKIAHEGLSAAAYRKQIRESLTMQHLQEREVASRITVSPDEINDSLQTTKLETQGEKEYHILDILVPVSDTPSPQEIAIAKKFAQDIMTRLRKGTQLNQLASAEAESLQQNDLSWRKLTEVPTAFTAPVTHMKPNTYSGPIQTSNGFHIIHLAGLRSLSEHVAKPARQEIAQAIFQRKFEEAMQGWIAKVRGQAFIEVYDKASA